MNEPIKLSLEQQFNLRSFETQVAKMSREQAQQFLVKLYEQMKLCTSTSCAKSGELVRIPNFSKSWNVGV